MCKQKLSYGFILFVSVLVAVSCSSNDKKSVKTVEMKEASIIEVSIGGMSCTGCEQAIQNNVGKLEGIKSVKASYTTGVAMIEYFQSMVDTSRIREAINGSGYTVNKFIAPARAEGEK